MEKKNTPHRRWGRRLIVAGIILLAAGLLLVAFADPLAAFYVLIASVALNAAGAYLLVFLKKKD